MCDSDEPGMGNSIGDDDDGDEDGGVDLTGFLFGNIDRSGKLEDAGLLDGESLKQLSALSRLGLGSMLQEVLEPGSSPKHDDDNDFSVKSPSAIDYFDIEDLADDTQVITSSMGEEAAPENSTAEVITSEEFSESGQCSNAPSEVSGPAEVFNLKRDMLDSSVQYSNLNAEVSKYHCPQNEGEDFAGSEDAKKMTVEEKEGEGSGIEIVKGSVEPEVALEANDLIGRGEGRDEGYEGDMEGDGGLMPPPAGVPGHHQSSKQAKKLETPLAAMLPSKYANVPVTEIFPDFRHDKVLRFSRLFGPGKASSLPQIWRGVKKRRRRKRTDSGGSDPSAAPPPFDPTPQYESDDEEKFLKPLEDTNQQNAESGSGGAATKQPTTAHWRFGPAQVWYDMLNVPESGEGFNYGFKKAPTPDPDEKQSDSPDSGFPDEAYLMVSQLQWEDDVIWDGNENKNKVLARLNSKSNAAGWLPTSVSRTAQQFSQPRVPHPTPQPKPSNSSTSTTPSNSQTGTGEDDTWYSIFPVENEELVYGAWEDEVIWDAENMPVLPKPKVLTLDPNDENIVLGIPDDVDPSKIVRERGPAPKVKIPHPHVKKSKILLGKAGVINVLQEDAPPPPPKSPDRDPFNISNDVYYTAKTSNIRLKVGGGQLIQHSTPVMELRAPFVQTHMGPARLRAFHRPALRKLSSGPLALDVPHPVLPLLKHIRKKAKQREAERLASGGGDVFFMRTPEDLSGKDGELVFVEYCEEHPPLISQVGMCTKFKTYYKRLAGKDPGPKPYKYGEIAFAHTSPFLGILPPGQSQLVVENNMYRAPIYEHNVPQTDFLVLRTRQGYFIREVDALFIAGQECPLYEVPGPNSKRANNFVRDFLQVFIYRLFWKSRENPRKIKMDNIKRAFPSHSESSIRKRLKQCADFKRTGLDSNWWVIKPDFRLPSEEEIRAMVSPEQCCAYFSMASAEQRLKDAGYGEKFLFAPQEDDDEMEMQLKMDDEVKVAPWNTTRAYIQAMRGKCLLQLTGPADPTGCGEGFSYVRVPNKPTQQPTDEQQPKRTVTGTDADLRRLSLNNAKALLRKFGVPEEEIKKLSRWEVIDVVRTLSTEKAKAGEEGMTKFSRGNRFSIAEHQERYKEECQRIFELQNRVLSSTEVLSTDEAESSVSEESDLEEMGKNLENMLANKKTTEQLSLEREEAERAELRKMILGDGEKKPQINQDQPQQSSSQGRVLRIVRTFRNAQGSRYTRVEYVRKQAVIEAYTKIRSTKDDSFIRQFATMDDAQKEEMKREKRRIQEQLRRIKRNQERERLAGNVTTPGPFGDALGASTSDMSSPSGMIPLGSIKQEDLDTPRKRRAKLKPDLKLKCGACGQVGHMRTNKACPLYTGGGGGGAAGGQSPRSIDNDSPPPDPDEEDMGYVEGTKLTLSSKIMKQAEEMKRRSLGGRRDSRGGRIARRRGTNSESCDYLVKRPAARRRTDPLVTLSSLLEDVLNHMRSLPDVQPFLFPVNVKLVADYYRIVSRPMDLQSIRENLRQKHYQSREEFLADVNQIVENSTLYNGPTSSLTVAAQRMLQRCVEKLAEKEDQIMKLEKQINPLLDDNDQVALSFILENLLTTKLKIMPEAWPFLKPVNKKQVKDYYSVIKKPIDMETMGKKIQAHKYHSRAEFLADIQLIVDNCRAYNGPTSQFTRQAESILQVTQSALDQFGDHVQQLEENIARVQQKMLEDADDDWGGEEEAGPSTAPPPVTLPPLPPQGDEKRGRGRPRKHKLDTSKDGNAPKKPRGRPKKDHNSLEEDLQYSDSESSEMEEVEEAAAAMVQLSAPYAGADELLMEGETTYDPSEMLIKREVVDEPPPLTDDMLALDTVPSGDMDYSAIVKEEPVELEPPPEPEPEPEPEPPPPPLEQEPEEPPLKQEPPEHWPGGRPLQDDLQVTDSEEENEDGLWF